MKKILIAIPTARYIESDTFKCIYDLEIPEGYETTFQCFYGYRVDQVRNLIADWVVKGFDYLFAVDHDVTFPPDTLKKLLAHDVPVVSGIYRQRLPEHRIEIYDLNQYRMNIKDVYGKGLVEIGGCGFGCVLVKQEVMTTIGYPQFEYHVSLDFAHTLSEDNDFCRKVRSKGFKIYCDSTILCGHIGSTTMHVEIPEDLKKNLSDNILRIAEEFDLNTEHKDYLNSLHKEGLRPRVMYDIGSCFLKWSKEAKRLWPDSKVIAFEAMTNPTIEKIYHDSGIEYFLGEVLYHTDNEQINFYQNDDCPFGNSIYQENEKLNPAAKELFSNPILKKTISLDTIREMNGLPFPDLIKLDVQGGELDVLKGASTILANDTLTDLIIETQHEEYNKGAPNTKEVFEFLAELGFQLKASIPTESKYDCDYHFIRNKKVASKALILYNKDNVLSTEYLKTAIQSCQKVGIEPIPFNGYYHETMAELEDIFGFAFGNDTYPMKDSAAKATASHFKMWEYISTCREPFIILEHDAIMLSDLDIEIPDNKIVVLGTKSKEYPLAPSKKKLKIADIKRHSGAHAYVITPSTAKLLLDELKKVGAERAIDNFYFMRVNQVGDTESSVPLAATNIPVAVGWVRESTIWDEVEPSEFNFT